LDNRADTVGAIAPSLMQSRNMFSKFDVISRAQAIREVAKMRIQYLPGASQFLSLIV